MRRISWVPVTESPTACPRTGLQGGRRVIWGLTSSPGTPVIWEVWGAWGKLSGDPSKLLQATSLDSWAEQVEWDTVLMALEVVGLGCMSSGWKSLDSLSCPL